MKVKYKKLNYNFEGMKKKEIERFPFFISYFFEINLSCEFLANRIKEINVNLWISKTSSF